MRKRTTRLTVEDCVAFSIRALNRAGVFCQSSGRYHHADWVDPCHGTPQKMLVCIEKEGIGAATLRICYRDPSVRLEQKAWVNYTIALVARPCRFGGLQRWFLCPIIRDGIACQRRVKALFLPPRSRYFGCRACHDLTYRSAQEHDQRVDDLSRLPIPELARLLAMPLSRRTALVLRALGKKRERLTKVWKLSRNSP
jgi:hypothetical protein